MDVFNTLTQWFHHANAAGAPLSPLDEVLFTIKGIISVIGTLVILVGSLVGAYRFFVMKFFIRNTKKKYYNVDFIRRDLGRTIVLGLEFIIAADVVETTTAPDYYSVGILAIVVVIRTFLSYTLNREITSLSQTEQSQFRE